MVTASIPKTVSSPLMTSMLPIPQSRAVNGLETQLGKRVAEENTVQPFTDLASYAVPLPTTRPVSIAVIPATAPERPARTVLASLVVGRSDAGQLLLAEALKNSNDNAMEKLQPMAKLPASATQDVSGGVGAMSTGAIVAWALQPPGIAMDMTLPGSVGAPIPLQQDAANIRDGIIVTEDDDFDVERFGFEG